MERKEELKEGIIAQMIFPNYSVFDRPYLWLIKTASRKYILNIS